MHVLKDYDLIEDVLQVFQDVYKKFPCLPCLTLEEAVLALPEGTEKLVDAVANLEPANGANKGTQNLAIISGSLLVSPYATRYSETFVRVTKDLLRDFTKMNAMLKKDCGVSVRILSGYRSPTYQALLFLGEYYSCYYDLAATLQKVMPPGYSEHGSSITPAIDIESVRQGEAPFEHTEAYAWLTKHAKEWGFYLSYPSTQNVMVFEPWHWHYKRSFA